jgi:pyrroloquinoline quinone biosynthesis protein B
VRIKVLGAAAGGGLPQWNCACTNCSTVRNNQPNIRARRQSQLAVSAEPESWFLINASPDLREQLLDSPELHPNSANGLRNTPVAGVILTSADLDHVLGLLLMREFTPVRIYATHPVMSTLKRNSFFQMLDRLPGQSRWTTIESGVSFHAGENLICTPIALSSTFPAYVREEDRSDLDSTGATIGIILEEVHGFRVAYLPALPFVSPSLKELLSTCSAILIDGTFWSDDELQSIQPGTPLARSMGHVPINGQNGSLATLSDLNGVRRIYTHINNTNPILNEQSSERRQVEDAGWEVAWDGLEIMI